MKVLDTRVLIKIEKKDAYVEKIGGFTVPVGAGEYDVAKVVAIGPEVKGLNVDETVYVYLNSGKEVTIEGEKYKVIALNEIIVVL